MKPTNTFARSTRRRATPPSDMMAPANTKNGMVSSAKSSMPSEIFSITASSGMSIHSAVSSVARPMAYATGMPRNIRTRNEKRRISPSTSSLGLRLIAEGERVLGRRAEPQALDAEEQRDHSGDGNRDVGHAGGEPRELGDRVLPDGLHQLHAPLHHEHADDAHADVAAEFQAAAVGCVHHVEQCADGDVGVGAVRRGAADE